MSNNEKIARFERFARMRLEGRSDVLYRAYDLLTPERGAMNVEHYLKMTGFPITVDITAREHLTALQSRFMKWGFPVITLNGVERLLHEFWVYDRIKNRGKKNWPYRDPDEARRLYEENERALKHLKEQELLRPPLSPPLSRGVTGS